MKLLLHTLTLFSLFLSNSFAAVNSSAEITNSRNAATSISSMVNSSIINNISNSIILPTTSGSTVTTLDGTDSGTAKLTCSEDSVLLSKITLLGSNNISINVKLDTDLNGSFERDSTFTGISGIHTTGVFKCLSGALACSYFKWVYSPSSGVSLESITSASAVSPYCINDSCNSLYLRNPTQILNNVSGVITALVQTSTNLVVTNATVTSTAAQVFAQKYSTCSNSSDSGVIYTSNNSSLPNNSVLESQATSVDPMSDGNVVLSSVVANESANPLLPSDLAELKTVASTSTSSISIDSGDPREVSYSTTYKDANGNFLTSSDDASINYQTVEPNYCMVEWQEVYSNVTTDNQVRGVTASGLRTTTKSESRLCSGAYNNVCPIASGETIKYDCGRLNDSINKAVASLNVLNAVIDDMICNIGN